jgi:uncharacterized membrane protein
VEFLKVKMHAIGSPVHARIYGRRRNRKGGLRVIDSTEAEQGAFRVTFFRGAETHSRSVLKAISWRTLGTLDTFAISWFMTGRAEIAGSIAAMEIITKIAWYYLHERIWAVIPWGRRQYDRMA